METLGEDSLALLTARFTELATIDVADAIHFLAESPGGEESAHRFAARLKEFVEALRVRVAEEIATLGKPYDEPNETASLRFSRPVYRERLETNKSRSRRSSSGLWYVFFTLESSMMATEQADTIVVLTIRHSAARPLSIEGESESGE